MPTQPTSAIRTNSLSSAIGAKKPGYTPPPAIQGTRPQAVGYNGAVDPYAHRSLTQAPAQGGMQQVAGSPMPNPLARFNPQPRPMQGPMPTGGMARPAGPVGFNPMGGSFQGGGQPAPGGLPAPGGYQGPVGFNPMGGSFQGGGLQAPPGVPPRGDYAPSPYTPPTYFPRQSPELGSMVPSADPSLANRQQARTAAISARQRELLGPYADFLPIDPSRPLQRSDVPLLQAGLIFENRAQSEEDMRRGIDELIRTRASVGNDPTQQLVREAAIARLQNSGGFDENFMDLQRGLIRNEGGRGLQAAQRAAQEDAARRGVGGLSPRDLAMLEQTHRGGVQSQLTGFETNARQARDEAERAALAQLQGISSEESGQRFGIDQLLANAYLQNQREVPDLMTLLTSVKHGSRVVGGGAQVKGDKKTVFGTYAR